MTITAAHPKFPEFDAPTLSRLHAFIQDRGLDMGPIRQIEPAGSGQSNPTYVLGDDQGRTVVLRRRPFGTLLASAHAIDREYRVMTALAPGPVPVPRLLAYCDDEELMGVPFYLMGQVQGRAFMDPRLPDLGRPQRRPLFAHMAKTLAHIHATDLSASTLTDFGAPGAYFERSLARWTKQYRAAETTPYPELEELMAWLANHLPRHEGARTLIHGDYRPSAIPCPMWGRC